MDVTNPSFLSGFGCGLCIGLSIIYFIRKCKTNPVCKTSDDINTYSADGDYRIVLIVRTDLNMTKGKIAAQCGHAAVGAIEKAQHKEPEILEIYKKNGQTKVALKIDSEQGIKDLKQSAKNLGLITSLVRDAGRTQIAANSVTVLAIGPAPKDVIDCREITDVRTDLNMTKGKIAAQCGHAAVGAIEKAQHKEPEILEIYKKNGQTKVALKIDSEQGIKDLKQSAKNLGLITSLVRDAGRTQIAANSVTVLAIGPAPKDVIDCVVGNLNPL